MMRSRRIWAYLLVALIGCSIAGGVWWYRSKCHGMDACAAAGAESHERDTPSESQ
jgi:hypothetical protein